MRGVVHEAGFLRSVFGVAALAVSSLAWAQPTVRIYNWIEYLPPQVLKDFEQETGIRPIYDVFDSVEILESKLLTGNSGYDVVFPGSSNIGKLIQAKALEPLDRAQLPNWSHLDASAMKTSKQWGYREPICRSVPAWNYDHRLQRGHGSEGARQRRRHGFVGRHIQT